MTLGTRSRQNPPHRRSGVLTSEGVTARSQCDRVHDYPSLDLRLTLLSRVCSSRQATTLHCAGYDRSHTTRAHSSGRWGPCAWPRGHVAHAGSGQRQWHGWIGTPRTRGPGRVPPPGTGYALPWRMGYRLACVPCRPQPCTGGTCSRRVGWVLGSGCRVTMPSCLPLVGPAPRLRSMCSRGRVAARATGAGVHGVRQS